MNIGTLLDDAIKRFGEHDSFHYDGKWTTNVELHREAGRLGNLLADLGIRRGDRVILQMLNCPEILAAFNAIYRLGAVAVPLSPLLRPDQASHIFRDCGGKAILTTSVFLDSVGKARQNAPELEHLLVMDRDDIPDTLPYRQRRADYPPELEAVETENEEVAALIYTAGTTGKPKGVMHTHFSLYINSLDVFHSLWTNRPVTVEQSITHVDSKTRQTVQENVRVTGVDRAATSLGVLPLSHSYGIAVMNTSALVGARTVLHPWWDAGRAMQDIERFGIDFMALVPTMYIQMLNHPDFGEYDLSSLKGCVCGSAPLPIEIARRWERQVGIEIREGWGMTESGATTCGQPADRPPKYGSIGKSLCKSNRVTLFNERGEETAPGEKGEIVVKGPTVMKGYWNKPEETAETIKDGWLYTGDIGYKDDDGYIFITDRKKDIIIRGGENVSPREVEEVLFQHPAVAEAGVVGMKDEVYGEEIKAFLVPRAGQQIDAEEVIAFCKQHLPNYKTPKVIRVVEALPRNPVGKVLRAELRKMQ